MLNNECTKHQAVFDPSPRFNKYRLAFFANTEHNRHVGQQEWLLNAFNTLAGSLDEEGNVSHAERLQRGQKVVARHYDCYGSLEHPPQWGSEVAWGVLRRAMLDETYWLSVEELQFLAACCRIGVHVYKFDEAEAADSGDAYKFESIGDDLYTDHPEMEECVHVVFESGDAGSSSRGHFSRLWPEEAWLEEALAADDHADEESCATSDDGSEEESSSESDAEDRQSSKPGQGDDPDLELPNPTSAQPGDAAGNNGEGQATPDPGRRTDDAIDATASRKRAASPGNVDVEKDDDELDALSDVTDNSDIFHADVLPEGEDVGKRTWVTDEDKILERVLRIRAHLRKYPLLPPCSRDGTGEGSYTNMESCARLPLVHCGFKGCEWSCDIPDDKLYHWRMEWELFKHLRSNHAGRSHGLRDAGCEMQEVFDLAEKASDPTARKYDRMDFLTTLSYYIAAVCEQEREHMPLVGPTMDRKMLALVARLATSESIKARMCFCCDGVYTDVHSWQHHIDREELDRSLYENIRAESRAENEIQMVRLQRLIEYSKSNPQGFVASFGLGEFKRKYAKDTPNGNPFENCADLVEGQGDWQCKLRGLEDRDFDGHLLCNPEDMERCAKCKDKPTNACCGKCQIAVCQQCFRGLFSKEPGGIPMSLGNDNFFDYTAQFLYKYDVTWLEVAIASPCWTTMLVYYIEGDRGHLFNEQFGRQRWRTRVRGTACTFQMPWEDIIQDLEKNISDEHLLEIPRPVECMQYVLRLHMKIGFVDFTKKLKQLHVRPHVVLLLLYFLIDNNHMVFRNKGTAEQLKERMRTAVQREYPETEGDKPEVERVGHIPKPLLAIINEAEAELDKKKAPDAESDALPCTHRQHRSSVFEEKNAVPGDGAREAETCLDNLSPVGCTLDRSVRSVSDPATQREGAYAQYGDGKLHVQTSGKFMRQWNWKWPSLAFPFSMPRCVSGPDFREDDESTYSEDKRRRVANAPLVWPRAWLRSMARRSSAAIRSDWTFIPAMRSSVQKWESNTIFSIAAPFAQRRGSATMTAARDLMQAAKNLSWHLVQGFVGSGPSRQPIKGDTTKLPYAKGLSVLEKRMAFAQSFLAKQMRYARNRSQRML